MIQIQDIIIIIAYILVLILLGFIGYRRTKSTEDYLLAGRKAHPLIMALSYGATFISTSAIVGFGGTAAKLGMSVLWLTVLNIIVGVFVAFVIFGKRTRRMGVNLDAHTFPELLGVRYQSKFIQVFSAIIIFLFMPIYAAAVLKGCVGFIATQFSLDYNVVLIILAVLMAIYVSIGGLKGVMYSDAFQAVIMFVGMAFLIIFVYAKLGGVTQAHQALTNMYNDPAVQAQTADLATGGFRGWTTMPETGSSIWWSVVSTITLGVGIGVLAQPQLATRFMTVKSNRELNRAVVSGGVFILFMTGVAFTVGALSNVFFYNKDGSTAMTATGNVDTIIPVFIKENLPAWFGTLFMLVLLSAAMSTMSSQYHAIGSSLGRDICEKGIGVKKHTVLITKIGLLIGIVLSALLAWLGNAVKVDIGVITQATTIFFGLCAASFLPAYIGAIYVRKASRAAATASIITGFVASFAWIFLIHGKLAASIGLSQILTGKASLLFDAAPEIAKFGQIDAIVIAFPLALLVFIAVTLLTRPKYADQHVENCFKDI